MVTDLELLNLFDIWVRPTVGVRKGLESALQIAANEFSGIKPLNLLLSGGADSELTLRSLVGSGIPVEAVTLRFRGGLNSDEVHRASLIASRFSVRHSVIDFDVEKFLDSGEYLVFCTRYGCASPQVAVHLWLLESLGSKAIYPGSLVRFQEIFRLPSGKVTFRKTSGQRVIRFSESLQLNDLAVLRCLQQTGAGLRAMFLFHPAIVAETLRVQDVSDHRAAIQLVSKKYPIEEFGGVRYYRDLRLLGDEKVNYLLSRGLAMDPPQPKATGFEGLHEKLGDRSLQDVYQRRLSGLERFNALYRKPAEQSFLAIAAARNWATNEQLDRVTEKLFLIKLAGEPAEVNIGSANR